MKIHGDSNQYISYNKRVSKINFDKSAAMFLVQVIDANGLSSKYTTKVFDYVIVATGQISATFMERNLRMRSENVYFPNQLYKGIVFVRGGNKRLIYLGRQKQAFSFPLVDAQARWSLLYVLGYIKIPGSEAMIKNIRKWTNR